MSVGIRQYVVRAESSDPQLASQEWTEPAYDAADALVQARLRVCKEYTITRITPAKHSDSQAFLGWSVDEDGRLERVRA